MEVILLLDLLRSGHLSRMAANNDDCHIGDDMDTLTVMNERNYLSLATLDIREL
jgi:hypothetical protein